MALALAMIVLRLLSGLSVSNGVAAITSDLSPALLFRIDDDATMMAVNRVLAAFWFVKHYFSSSKKEAGWTGKLVNPRSSISLSR